MKQVLAPALIAATLALGGCAGFQPLYAQSDVTRNLASIQVTAPALVVVPFLQVVDDTTACPWLKAIP